MKGFDFLKIKSGVNNRSKEDISFDHLTTMQIGEIIPLGVIDSVPSDQFTVNYNIFSRVAPLVRPTYGRLRLKTVVGFVPFHMVAADAEAWLAGKTTWEGYTPHDRYIEVLTLHSLFSTLANALMTTTGATQANCDYVYINASGVTVYMILTEKGKYYLKILQALGYNLPSGADLQTGSAWMTNEASRKLSAYPILCFFKLYNDYLSQSQRFNTSQLSNILNAIKYGKFYAGIWQETTGIILSPGLLAMFNSLLLNYENDYFTSAWQSPNAPLSSVENITSISAPGSNIPISDTATDTTAGLPVSGGVAALPQRVLDYLKSFDAWIRRNNYSGSKSVQQIYSRFGIKTSDFYDHYSEIIKVDEYPIQVGDVTAVADASGFPLGDFAGKAIVSAKGGFNYRVNDHGILFVLGFITVSPINGYGYHRRVTRTSPLDYFNPEFDGLGAEAISVGEYFGSPIDENHAVLDSSVYGFTERYNSYRFGRDVISGEFRNYHPNADMNSWHFGRNMASIRDAGQLLAQNTAVNTLPQVNSEYNRIFNVIYSNVDHFYLTCQFGVDAIRPMKNLNQVVGLGEGDTVVARNGNTIS